MKIGQHHITLVQTTPRRPLTGCRRRATLVLSASAALALSASSSALATSSSGVTGTIDVATTPVYSLTVAPSSVTFCSATAPLNPEPGLGNQPGSCQVGAAGTAGYTGGVTITNAGTAAHIDVAGTNAVPSDNGTPWALCQLGSTCTGIYTNGLATGSSPGTDQVLLATQGLAVATGRRLTAGTVLTTTPQCDTAIAPAGNDKCAAGPGASFAEGLNLIGPQVSTDTSGHFTTAITWIAGP